MPAGVGVGGWDFSSPDFPVGAADEAALGSNSEESPYVTGPSVGGYPDTSQSGTGTVHVNTGANPGGQLAGRARSWANAFDWKNGPLFWLMVATILYFGLIAIRVNAGVSFGR